MCHHHDGYLAQLPTSEASSLTRRLRLAKRPRKKSIWNSSRALHTKLIIERRHVCDCFYRQMHARLRVRGIRFLRPVIVNPARTRCQRPVLDHKSYRLDCLRYSKASQGAQSVRPFILASRDRNSSIEMSFGTRRTHVKCQRSKVSVTTRNDMV